MRGIIPAILMTLAAGTKVGPYVVVSLLGAGGMGEVYRARDSRLGRDVALKILPENFAGNAERLKRFESEARAVAALNHPNILAIHDVGEHNGTPFLVSELLEGESLRAVLDRGAMAQRKVVEFAVQVAQGLAAAHEKNIVHRDLKPENLFQTHDGRAKILDFGLAKLMQGDSVKGSSDGQTLTSAHTAAGVVMGTASYMAPEQVRGEPADHRTDIFAFGAVLFEMLSGKRAFLRETAAETMTAVLRAEPPEMGDTGHALSAAMDRIVRRCLEKSPEQRFQSAKDLSFALAALSGSDTGGSGLAAAVPVAVPAKPARPWPWLGLAVAAVLSLILVAWWAIALRQKDVRQQFSIPVQGEVSQIALSADGKMLAYVAPDIQSGQSVLYVEEVGSGKGTLIPETEGASYPFWSPDHAAVAFFAHGKLQKVAVPGGTPQVLSKVAYARGGSWGSRNVIIYAPDAGGILWRVNADGTGLAALTQKLVATEENSHRFPYFLPDGNHFLFWAGNFKNIVGDASNAIYASSLDGKEKKVVASVRSNFAYAAGSLFYVDDKRQLVAAPFDVKKTQLTGSPRVVTPEVGFQTATYWGVFAAAEDGTVVYSPSAEAAHSVLTWFDRGGKELGHVGSAGVLSNPSLSPDGKRVAVDISDSKSGNVDVWIESVDGTSNERFTFDTTEEVAGVFSRDGGRVAYRAALGSPTVFVKSTSGLERPKPAFISSHMDDILPDSWSRDDQQMLCTLYAGTVPERTMRGPDLMLVSLGDGSARPFIATSASETNAQISPDGKWVAYASDESGEMEIYVTTFPDAQGKWQVSRGGGSEPRWRADGKELYYLNPKEMLMAVPVNAGDTFSSGTPVALFQILGRAYISSTDTFTYDVARDGSRFLVNYYLRPASITPLTILLHAMSNEK